MLEVLDGRAQATPVHIPRPRPVETHSKAAEDVAAIVEDVRLRGDEAILDRRDPTDPTHPGPMSGSLRVPEELIDRATSLVRPEFVNALEVMEERLRRTCERQVEESWMDRAADDLVGELVRPLRRVGVHVPGGRHVLPSSIVMAVVPAQVAGVEGIAIAVAPDDDGEISESVLAVCAVLGVTEVYRMGGPGAIAALAHGTESVRPVEKIVGPGDALVRSAKRLVRDWVGVDADTGPAELAIVADGSASPRILAADLIAQAEHGPNGAHVLITWEPNVAEQVISSLDLQVATHERSDDVENALIEGGRAVLVRDLDHALDTANAFAPQHLQLHIDNAIDNLDRVGMRVRSPWGRSRPFPRGITWVGPITFCLRVDRRGGPRVSACGISSRGPTSRVSRDPHSNAWPLISTRWRRRRICPATRAPCTFGSIRRRPANPSSRGTCPGWAGKKCWEGALGCART